MIKLKHNNIYSSGKIKASAKTSKNLRAKLKKANSILIRVSKNSVIAKSIYAFTISPLQILIKYGYSDFIYYIAIKSSFLSSKILSILQIKAKFDRTYAFPLSYQSWIYFNELSSQSQNGVKSSAPLSQKNSIRFSFIIPVFKVDAEILLKTLTSVINQTYSNWEMCVAYSDIDNKENLAALNYFAKNDNRIKIAVLELNLGISGNSMKALELATGEFVVLLDHDDEIPYNILSKLSDYISQNPSGDFFYTDRDCINLNSTLRSDPLFKPQWSPELLISANYLTHLNVIRRKLLIEIGGWRSQFDGAQDWDLFFRISQATKNIHRIEGIGYHWRLHSASTSQDLSVKPYAGMAQINAIQDHINHLGLKAEVIKDDDGYYRLFWDNNITKKVDLIICRSEFTFEDLGLLNKITTEVGLYLNRIIFVTDNNIVIPPEFILTEIPHLAFVPKNKIAIKLINDVLHEQSEGVIVIGDSIYNFSEYSLIEMISWIFGHPEIGVVGGILLDKKDSILECGRVVNQTFDHLPLYNGVDLNAWTFFGSTNWYRTVSAVSPLFVAIKRNICNNISISDINEDVKFNNFCVNICSEYSGLRVMLNPFARANSNRIDFIVSQNQPSTTCLYDKYFNTAFADSSTTKLKSNF